MSQEHSRGSNRNVKSKGLKRSYGELSGVIRSYDESKGVRRSTEE